MMVLSAVRREYALNMQPSFHSMKRQTLWEEFLANDKGVCDGHIQQEVVDVPVTKALVMVEHAGSSSIPVELPAPRPAGVVPPKLVATIDSAHVPVVLHHRLWARYSGACAVLLLPLNLAQFLGLRA